ncbi:hypothetical protein HKI87_10g63360 [Chloropicon roscoffensis]|uniref:APC family permease n=1 Tax=Chloropicon roscoffensis TaxID=1461544 RepID=A0AAX4PFS5_9CHLO|mmetsp:Transcript_37/g.132  ORF Transcript_37/g.132 Transcript_37/m.132 type:complete len:97 (-) Transcript_37:1429-1719(-)
MGTTTLSLFAGFALLIYAGVMAYEYRSASDVQGVSGLPFNVAAILASAFALTLFGSVGVGGDLVPIKAQAGDRIYEPLTYRPSFMGFNHRIVPGTD